MNIFNRVLVVLGLVLTMVVLTLLLAFPVQSLSVVVAAASALMRLYARIRPEFTALVQAVLIVIAILVDFVLLVLLIAEFRRPRQKYIRVQSIAGGHVGVTIDSIANRLRYHIDPLPDVLAVKPRVSRKRDGVALALEVEATADVNVPRKAEEVLEITRQVIEEKMGLKLADKPQIMIRTVTAPGGSSSALARAPEPDSQALTPVFTPSSAETPET